MIDINNIHPASISHPHTMINTHSNYDPISSLPHPASLNFNYHSIYHQNKLNYIQLNQSVVNL